MLTARQARILELLIKEYVESAEPVASKSIGHKYTLNISSATIRSEMADLEEQGYLTHPHTSSGRVPTDKGYRFYVESLMREERLPWEVQQTIRHQFHQVERGQEAWMHLAASVLAQAVENAAVVTAPHADACRIKHLELVSLHERTALLVLVLDESRVEQQLVELDEPCDQTELTEIAARLNRMLAGLTAIELAAKVQGLPPLERIVTDVVEEIVRGVDEGGSDEAYLDGLRHVLSQPEFSDSQRTLELLELLDEGNFIRTIPLRALAGDGVTVIIGADNPRLAGAGQALRECSVVIGTYGEPGVASGTLAVLGPMRMRYSRTISTVRYLADVMSELVSKHQD